MIRTIWTHLDICRKCAGQSKLFPIYFSNWEGKGDAPRAKKNHSILRFLSLVKWTLFCMDGQRVCHLKSDVINSDQFWSLQNLPITSGEPSNCRCYSHCFGNQNPNWWDSQHQQLPTGSVTFLVWYFFLWLALCICCPRWRDSSLALEKNGIHNRYCPHFVSSCPLQLVCVSTRGSGN